MPQPVCEDPGSITERLLAQESGLGRLWGPLAGRYGPCRDDSGRDPGPGGGTGGGPGGGTFAKYPGWDEKPHPWSQRAGSGDHRGRVRGSVQGEKRAA